MLKVAFRVDASLAIGGGHVYRCLALADELRKNGAECLFISRSQHRDMHEQILQQGYELIKLSDLQKEAANSSVEEGYGAWLGVGWEVDANETRAALENRVIDWLVVDHYAIDHLWERFLQPKCKYLMVIDDLANRLHNCDILLDQNLGRIPEDYAALVSGKTKLLIGPQYALLRSEFSKLRPKSIERRLNPRNEHLLISMGGVDANNLTGQLLAFLGNVRLPIGSRVTVVMGSGAPHLESVQLQAKKLGQSARVLVGVKDMASLMANSDLSIGAAGGTAWERCSLGLPSLVLVMAENQKMGAMALEGNGAAIVIQKLQEVNMWLQKLFISTNNNERLLHLSLAAAQVTDGRGIFRVSERMGAFRV